MPTMAVLPVAMLPMAPLASVAYLPKESLELLDRAGLDDAVRLGLVRMSAGMARGLFAPRPR